MASNGSDGHLRLAHLGRNIGTALAACPGQNRSGFVLAQQGDRFIVCLSSCGGEELSTPDRAMAEYADSLVAPDVAEIIHTATLLTEPVLMRYPASVRRHHELLDQFPEDCLVILCSFNRVYGQSLIMSGNLQFPFVKMSEAKLWRWANTLSGTGRPQRTTPRSRLSCSE